MTDNELADQIEEALADQRVEGMDKFSIYGHREDWERLVQVLRNLRPEGRDAQDAARYRWLRAGGYSSSLVEPWPPKKFPTAPWCICVDLDHSMPCNRPIEGAELDAAIDAAIALPQPQPGEVK